MSADSSRPVRARFPAYLPVAGEAESKSGAASARPARMPADAPRKPTQGGHPVSIPTGNGLDSQAVCARMVERLRAMGGLEQTVLEAMLSVPRHRFLEPGLSAQAYSDNALPIGHGQTISKPSVVARCASVLLQSLGGRPERVLEIGTGCGYQAAILSRISGEVYSIERIRALHELARTNLRALRLPNLRLLLGDGTTGAACGAPFDAVLSAAASPDIPAQWLQQLRIGGVVLAPVGHPQRLMAYRKHAGGKIESWCVEDAHFVPLKSGVL